MRSPLDIRGPLTITNEIESFLAPWESTTVQPSEIKILLAGGDDSMARISLYYLPARGIVVRYVPAQQPGDRWQTIKLPTKEEAEGLHHILSSR